MDNEYVFLMSVYNDIEAENVAGILKMEGIEAKLRESPENQELTNINTYYFRGIDIYVPEHSFEKAMEIIQTEMARGDF